MMHAHIPDKSGPDISITISDSKEDDKWDDFLQESEYGHFEQSSAWAKAKSIYGWEPIKIFFYEGGKLIGGAQILKKPIFFWGSIGYLIKGPVFRKFDEKSVLLFISVLKELLKKNCIFYFIIQPPDKAFMVERWLEKAGFEIEQMIGVVGATTIIDLTLEEDPLFSKLSKENRKKIKKGYRNNIQVIEGTKKDIPVFFNLMRETCKRQNVEPNPMSQDFFFTLWDSTKSVDNVKLLLAKYDDQIISGNFLIPFRDTVHAWKFGWSGKYGELKPNEVLYWEVIKWAKRNGYKNVEFVGISRKTAGLIKNGKSFLKFATGADLFKLSFRGDVYLLPNAYCYIYNPLLRFVYSKLFLKLKGKSSFSNIITRLKKFI